MTPKPEDVLVRGTPVLGLCHFIEKELSAEVRDGIYRRLPEPFSQRFVKGSILASDRIPLSVVNLLTTLAAEPGASPSSRSPSVRAPQGRRRGSPPSSSPSSSSSPSRTPSRSPR